MWLLKTDTLELEYFVDERATKYAILSHTWAEEEVSFQDIRGAHLKSKKGFHKIERTCMLALSYGYKHVWIDTCCINKESSAELSEAVNSMFSYYSAAKVCYVYLEDVVLDSPKATGANRFQSPTKAVPAQIEPVAIRHAKWFTRGWTLQELIAPPRVRFFDANWVHIGSRQEMSTALATITDIDEGLLKGSLKSDLSSYSVAARLAWAANRQTTRREDRAYSLLGIFDINMPLLYGEGEKAFQRLQEEIIRRTDDLSILAWTCAKPTPSVCALLAPSPDCFAGLSQIVRWRSAPTTSSHLTNVALVVDLPVVKHGPFLRELEHYLVLNCHFKDDPTGPLSLCVSLLQQNSDSDRPQYLVQTHRRLRGTYERTRVISYDVVSQAVTKRCNLYPRFSDHGHWPPPRHAPAWTDDCNPYRLRRVWVQVPESTVYSLELVEGHPESCWTDKGVFRPERGNPRIVGLNLPGTRSEVQNGLDSPLCRGESIWVIEDINHRWTFGISIKLYWSRSEIYLFNPTESRSRILGQEDSDPAQLSVRLDQRMRVTAQLKLDQKIMDQVVDVVSLSIPDARKDNARNSPGLQAMSSSQMKELRLKTPSPLQYSVREGSA